MKQTAIVVTGASGFIGKYLLDYFKEEYTIYAIARRTRMEANIPYHKNIRWIQCDISNKEVMNEVAGYINENDGADFFFHLAAFYDFSYNDNPEYHRTNVIGTENALNMAKSINIKHFIFSSSVAACNFPENDEPITEKSILNAEYAYAVSKKDGEELLWKYSDNFKCTTVRLAAVFSDWCEYAPLYKFLSTWLAKKLDSKILAGKGKSAIPYIHINDLCNLLKKIIIKHEVLPVSNVFIASPNGSTNHLELFTLATRYFFGVSVKPWFLPHFLAYPGLFAKNLLSYLKLTCYKPFEKIWMIKYIDKVLNIDASYTHNLLDWHPTVRYHISRRLLFLLEKMKSHKDVWELRNEAALNRVARRANILIFESLTKNKSNYLPKIIDIISTKIDTKCGFDKYSALNEHDFQCYMSTLYHLLMATVRSNDRNLMLQYIDDIAIRRFAEGFLPHELCATLQVYKDILVEELLAEPELKKFKLDIYSSIALTLQLAQDEVEDLYETLIKKIAVENIADSALMPDCEELQRNIRQLSAFYQISPDNPYSKKVINLSDINEDFVN